MLLLLLSRRRAHAASGGRSRRGISITRQRRGRRRECLGALRRRGRRRMRQVPRNAGRDLVITRERREVGRGRLGARQHGRAGPARRLRGRRRALGHAFVRDNEPRLDRFGVSTEARRGRYPPSITCVGGGGMIPACTVVVGGGKGRRRVGKHGGRSRGRRRRPMSRQACSSMIG
jgi:hypothetical protein